MNNPYKSNKKNTYEKKIISWQDTNSIKKITEALKINHICITSTDTTLGLLANITFKSFKKLNQIKGNRKNKPYLLLISSPKRLAHFVDKKSLTNKHLSLISHCWPGPVTLIFKAKQGLPQFLQSKKGTIAIRCPKHTYLQNLLQSFKGLFSTSANKSKTSPPQKIFEIDHTIIQKIKYLAVDTNRLLYQTLPSSIIDISRKKVVRVVREGSFPIKKLEQYYGEHFTVNQKS
jgi:L-threonylcarbamoyladenylate synthase